MMTSTLALLALWPVPQAPSAKELIQNMLVRYNAAKTVTGSIKLTVTAAGGSASLDTALQYERPSKLYLSQQKKVANPDPSEPTSWLVTSDGKMFSYNISNDLYKNTPGLRLAEPVENSRVKVTHDLGSIYFAASQSIGDRSMPLDIAISAKDDLVYRRSTWATYQVTGQKEINGKKAYIVEGGLRMVEGGRRTASGTEANGKYPGNYLMAITQEGDLLQYIEKITFATDRNTIDVTSVWSVDLKVNGVVDPALFKVVLK